jgi:hypothetical protein
MSDPVFTWSFPLVITPQGVQPQTPASLIAQVSVNALANSPGITQNLPGSMISDMTGTVAGAVSVMDQARVDAINSLTPFGCNTVALGQLGQLYLGQTAPGLATNTSVNVVFQSPNVGWIIPNGFLITDGTYTYQIQVGGVIGTSGFSGTLTAIAVQSGSWAIAANTAFTAASSVPSTISITGITNALAGTPAGSAETWGSFRSRVLTAGLAACTSGPRLIKTLIGAILGASSNLISVQQASGGLRICVGGGADVYQIAYAIFMSVGNVGLLQGSAVNNDRNITVSLIDFPDTYSILFVQAPVQTLSALELTWNTTLTSFTGGAAIPGLVQPDLASYVNNLAIGQDINEGELNTIFTDDVADVLDSSLISALDWTVEVGGTPISPTAGTWLIEGDPESSWSVATTAISITQG